MLLIADIKDKKKQCNSCKSGKNTIEIIVLDEKSNKYESIVLCEECKTKLIDRLLPF